MSLKAKITAQLKAKLKELKITLSAARIKEISERLDKKIDKEEDIESRIDDLNDVMPFEVLAKQDAQVQTLEQQIRERQTASNDNSDEDDESDEEDEKPTPKKVVKKTTVDKVPKWAQGLIDELKELKSEKQQNTIKEKFKQTLKEKNLPEHLAKYVSIEKEEDIEAKITELEADFKPVTTPRAILKNYQPVASQSSATTGKTKEEIKKIFNN